MSRVSALRIRVAAAVAALALGAGIALLWPRGEQAPDVRESAKPPEPPVARVTESPVASTPSTDGNPEVRPAASALPAGDQAREVIEALAITYDPASVPALARFLAHADPDIRDAAREGLVTLGERAAIPALEEAARRAGDPAEARALREAAEFLALPSWTERRAALSL